MSILKYNNKKLSAKLNCAILKDCSGNTITSNPVKALSVVTRGNYSEKEYSNIFHILLESTALTTALALKYKNLKQPALFGIGACSILYIMGRHIKNKKYARTI